MEIFQTAKAPERWHLNPDLESTKGLKYPFKESNLNCKGTKILQNKFYKDEKVLPFDL